jgi:hypothetical protein
MELLPALPICMLGLMLWAFKAPIWLWGICSVVVILFAAVFIILMLSEIAEEMNNSDKE